MRVARSFSELRTLLPPSRTGRIWLVPTMGALHDGHGALIDRARSEGGFVAVSIFVNPLQFGPGEDLDRYPRTEEADLAFLERRGTDLVFLPSAREIVPPKRQVTVSSGAVGRLFCGASRPDHFDGVLTIVLKLFHLFSPEGAVFGEKDRQQLFLIQTMVRDFDLPVRVLGHPTVRDVDGLALSSRNRYLSPEERKQASVFPALLDHMARRWSDLAGRNPGERLALRSELARNLEEAGFRVDYVAIADRQTFSPVSGPEIPVQAFLLAAVFLGKTRLIDNRELSSSV
ncbi:MAG: pantoate--beta-alanine ligase [Nitrospirae bacterium]|nr:pantoate--beta-alanine ligase [Nitrospirota bacterium]MCL5284713.1 pantoate--beta-alanine ligase [Nitrospirota bacterium]